MNSSFSNKVVLETFSVQGRNRRISSSQQKAYVGQGVPLPFSCSKTLTWTMTSKMSSMVTSTVASTDSDPANERVSCWSAATPWSPEGRRGTSPSVGAARSPSEDLRAEAGAIYPATMGGDGRRGWAAPGTPCRRIVTAGYYGSSLARVFIATVMCPGVWRGMGRNMGIGRNWAR